VISAKRPKLSASRPVVNGNGRSLTDLLKPTATGDRLGRTAKPTAGSVVQIHTSLCGQAGVRFRCVVCTAAEGGVAGDEGVGNDRIPQ
jgi:hypothetical protein